MVPFSPLFFIGIFLPDRPHQHFVHSPPLRLGDQPVPNADNPPFPPSDAHLTYSSRSFGKLGKTVESFGFFKVRQLECLPSGVTDLKS